MDDAGEPLVDVVIPARNCEGPLRTVLTKMPARGLRSVIVVDSGSTDHTAHVARDLGAIVLREPRPGHGAACRRALAHLESLPRQPQVVVFMPADGSVEPGEVRRLVEPISRDNAELVIGVRERSAWQRPALPSRVTLGLLAAIYGHPFQDLGPFRAVRFAALVALGVSDRGAGWNVEMMVRAVKMGLHIVEVPITARAPERTTGWVEVACETSRSLLHILLHSTVR